jgi:hypothetical protein
VLSGRALAQEDFLMKDRVCARLVLDALWLT